MEILVVALAALATLLIPLMLVMAEVAVLAVSALAELAVFVWQWLATGSVDAAREARQSRRQSSAWLRRWAWWLVAASGGTLAVTLLVIVALNFFCFDWFVRQALRTCRAAQRHRSDVCRRGGQSVLRPSRSCGTRSSCEGDTPVSDFDLSAATFDVDADVRQLLARGFCLRNRDGQRRPRRIHADRQTRPDAAPPPVHDQPAHRRGRGDGSGGPVAPAPRGGRAAGSYVARNRGFSQLVGGV